MSKLAKLDRNTLRHLLGVLGKRIAETGKVVEIAIYGGAAVVLTMDTSRQSTKDIDFAMISGDRAVLDSAALEIAQSHGLPDDWLNDAVDIFTSDNAEYSPCMEFPVLDTGLRIFPAKPEYLLAMKSWSPRSSLESHDAEDIWHIAGELGITDVAEIEAIHAKYFPDRELSEMDKSLLTDILKSRNSGENYNPMIAWHA